MYSLLLQKTTGPLHHEESLVYQEGHLMNDWKVRFTSIKHLLRRTDKVLPNEIPVGTIEFINACLTSIYKVPPVPDYYPSRLHPWMYRKIWHARAKSVFDDTIDNVKYPFFVKPRLKLKAFTGQVICSSFDLTRTISKNTPLVCAEVVEFTTEWRVYIKNGKICHIGAYMGNESILPPMEEVEKIVVELLNNPWQTRNTCIDVGLLKDGKLALVEVGDGYSIGAYGIDKKDYLELLTNRWVEMKG